MTDKIQQLVNAFPTLRNAGGIEPWNPHEFDGWACGGAAGDGAKHAARFVLAVWDNAGGWRCGQFDVVEAFSVWDPTHRSAFLAWANDPWWT
jgi:hypothetical protein